MYLMPMLWGQGGSGAGPAYDFDAALGYFTQGSWLTRLEPQPEARKCFSPWLSPALGAACRRTGQPVGPLALFPDRPLLPAPTSPRGLELLRPVSACNETPCGLFFLSDQASAEKATPRGAKPCAR